MQYNCFLVGAAVLAVGCDAPETPPAAIDSDEPAAVVCAATAGGNGGAGGVVLLASTQPDLEGLLDGVVHADPGDAGLGGEGDLAMSAPDGAPGEADGDVEFALADGFAFDRARVDPAHTIEISVSGTNVISLPELSDPPEIRVEELRIRSGASLAISCDTRIVAAHLIVEVGASLVFQARNQNTCTWSMPAHAAQPGLAGAKVFIEAGTVTLDGTIDVSGGDGLPGAPGGAGGGLTIRAETFEVGPAARILATVGHGGDGADEGPC
ncbi:MAG: hypothetical protein AAF721_34225 [Myxococcota bacterium]